MKSQTIKDFEQRKVRLANRCAECGAVLRILHGDVGSEQCVNIQSGFTTDSTDGRCYCFNCVAEYANQKDLEE